MLMQLQALVRFEAHVRPNLSCCTAQATPKRDLPARTRATPQKYSPGDTTSARDWVDCTPVRQAQAATDDSPPLLPEAADIQPEPLTWGVRHSTLPAQDVSSWGKATAASGTPLSRLLVSPAPPAPLFPGDGEEQAGAGGGEAPLAGLAARFREVSLSPVAGLGTSPRWSPGDLLCTSPAEEQPGPVSPPPAVGESVAPAPVIPAMDSGADVGAAATVPAAMAPIKAFAAAADAAEAGGVPEAEAGASCRKVCVCVLQDRKSVV